MKLIIAAAIVFCAALIGVGAYYATKEDTGPRQVPLHQAYTDRLSKGGWTKGEGSKVTLVEYGDFQCPACAFMYSIVQESVEQTKDVVTLTYRHYPLPTHDKAQLSAAAAESAGKQGKFWEMHNLLYENQQQWTTESVSAFRTRLTNYATSLELDATQFKRDLDEAGTKEQVQKDAAEGDKVPVQGTPTLVLNGKVIDPAPRTSAELTQLIREAATNAGN